MATDLARVPASDPGLAPSEQAPAERNRPKWKITALLLIGPAVIYYLFLFVMQWDGIFWGNQRSLVQGAIVILCVAGASSIPLLLGKAAWPAPTAKSWIGLICLSLAAAIFTATWVLDRFPNSGDEYAYLFQAHTYLAGRLYNDVPPLGQAMGANYLWVGNGKWVGQYPPGWPLVLALFGTLHLEWLANPVVVAATGVLVAWFCHKRGASDAAWLVGCLFLLSPYSLFNAGSLFSHPLAALLATATALLLEEARRRDSIRVALIAGLCIGFLGLTRNVTVAAVLLAFLPFELRSLRGWWRLAAAGVGALPSAAALLWYQYRITGDPMKPAYWLAGRTVDHLYFDLPSIEKGIVNNNRAFGELELWVSPLLLLLWLVAFVMLLRARKITPADLIFPAGILVFCFYPLHAGMRYGPRYFFDFWPLAMVTIGSVSVVLPSAFKHGFRQALIASICLSIVSWPMLAFIWHKVTLDRQELYNRVEEAHLDHAVVCVDASSGKLLPLPASDAVRNDIRSQAPVLYVRCNLAGPDAIHRAFPTRSVWLFTDSGLTKLHDPLR